MRQVLSARSLMALICISFTVASAPAAAQFKNAKHAVEYRQGATLGSDRKHWFRAKFFQQYRLFFRYHAQAKMIVYAWVNDEDTKRAYQSSEDAYLVFRTMVERGHPPDDWEQLLRESQAASPRLRRYTLHEK